MWKPAMHRWHGPLMIRFLRQPLTIFLAIRFHRIATVRLNLPLKNLKSAESQRTDWQAPWLKLPVPAVELTKKIWRSSHLQDRLLSLASRNYFSQTSTLRPVWHGWPCWKYAVQSVKPWGRRSTHAPPPQQGSSQEQPKASLIKTNI